MLDSDCGDDGINDSSKVEVMSSNGDEYDEQLWWWVMLMLRLWWW